MFLHLGNGVSVRTKDVIAIQAFALFQNGPGKELLEAKRQAGLVVNTLELAPEYEHESIKALVLTEDRIYLSVISPLTLKRRSELAFTTIDVADPANKTTETSMVTE